MKRILVTITGTVLGLVALLSFKSHGTQVGAAGALPSATLPTDSASSSARPAGTPSAAATRTVLGNAIQTRYGAVQVTVTVTGSKITNVRFAQLSAYDGRSEQIHAQAAPILLQQTLSAQSARIDGVSGASYTTEGYLQSLQSGLDKAGVQ